MYGSVRTVVWELGAGNCPRLPARNVYVQSRAAGERVKESLERFLWKRLRLRINREKSAVGRPWTRRFLGYSVTSNLQPRLKVAPQSIKRLKAKLKPFWRRARGRNLASTIADLNRFIRGWVGYYRLADVRATFEALDPWIRRKLRCILWRQWKKPQTRYKRLRQAGVDGPRAHAGAMNPRGPWWNAGSSHMNQAVSNQVLRQMGLVSFLDEYRRLARTS